MSCAQEDKIYQQEMTSVLNSKERKNVREIINLSKPLL